MSVDIIGLFGVVNLWDEPEDVTVFSGARMRLTKAARSADRRQTTGKLPACALGTECEAFPPLAISL